MTNWAEKARDFRNQENLNNELKIKAAQKEYYDGVIVGFKTLDDLGVEQMLTGIRNQVWRSGEIIKIPTQHNLNQTLEEIKTLQGRIELPPTPQPQYVLVTSSIERCKVHIDVSDSNYGHTEEIDGYGEKIYTLGIYYFRNSIGIYAADNDQYEINAYNAEHSGSVFKKINTVNRRQEEIKKWLEKQLIIDCSQRRGYKPRLTQKS